MHVSVTKIEDKIIVNINYTNYIYEHVEKRGYNI